MIQKGKQVFIVLFILGLLTSELNVTGEVVRQLPEIPSSVHISSDAIIQQGLNAIGTERQKTSNHSIMLSMLKDWYKRQPLVAFASLIGSSITVKFVGGSYTVIMDAFSDEKECPPNPPLVLPVTSQLGGPRTAVLMNPFEYLYGHQQCNRIITILVRHQYHVEYLPNEAVDVSYLRHNLTADVIYMDTHAGYFDLDGDQQADSVVIASGEPWTNDTETTYAFEYQHHLIVKGMVGDQGFVTFTPSFIEYYYSSQGFPQSLIYMATCYATFDASMAQAFLDAGASVYMGWSKNTVFWTNGRTSVTAFRLLASGWTVKQVCTLIRFGGVYNRVFHSKLIYYGAGDFRIPT